jgi:hypothetical protein
MLAFREDTDFLTGGEVFKADTAGSVRLFFYLFIYAV